ncbi:MAG: response regulator [Roseitalea sp.]|nr:response regulator [Oceaniradius stylonematis]MBO6551781.1 response regulator [Roseitalea sp.]MBO6951839.1 response regulator [Rhizobiaceae bacterium]MBO6592315.1 response regulator [Roseitalea sp.]MBO6598570.1 response regulator [Roseitalea sp.]MBO6611016.1 response regulator [Roseitalea sp.]
MIVEKSAVVRKVSKRILGADDRSIIEAETAAEALAMCDAQMPDTIIVEADPADMELVEFIRALRQMEGGAVPVVIVAMIEMDLVCMTKAKRAGADDYLLKPFDRAQLLSRFEQVTAAAA